MTLSPFRALPHRLDPRRFPPSPVTDPRRRIILPHRPDLLNIGGFQRDPATGGFMRDRATGGYRRNAWTENAPCCCSGSGVSGSCPCGSGASGTQSGTWRITLAGWTTCNLNSCGGCVAGSGIICQIGWKFSAASIGGTYCLHPGGIAPMYVEPACVYYAYVSTGVSGVYYPDASSGSQCSGRTFTVTGFSLYAEIASQFNNLTGATPVGILAVCAAIKSDGTNVTTASDFQTAPYVWSVADLGLYGFWDGSCGGTITWNHLGYTSCASMPPSYTLNIGGSAVGTDIAC